MKFEVSVHEIECQHPFGEGIHVLIPPQAEMIPCMVQSLGLLPKLKEDCDHLENLLTPGKAARKITVYKGERPQRADRNIFVILNLTVKEDSNELEAIFVMVEDGYEKLGDICINLMRKEFATFRDHKFQTN
jgi:hypothetical protein